MTNKIEKWKSILDLTEWNIITEKIQPEQVVYPADCKDEERYFIGIEKNHQSKQGIIYHDVELYEEAIVHELLHVKHPSKSERWVNRKTKVKIYQDRGYV